MMIQASYHSCALLNITLQSRGKLSPNFDLLYMCYIGNGEYATYFDQITVGELSKVNVKGHKWRARAILEPTRTDSDEFKLGGLQFPTVSDSLHLPYM